MDHRGYYKRTYITEVQPFYFFIFVDYLLELNIADSNKISCASEMCLLSPILDLPFIISLPVNRFIVSLFATRAAVWRMQISLRVFL